MAMRTETALRFPAWLIAAPVVVGVALGLWQVGVFDRSSDGGSGANTLATARSVARPGRDIIGRRKCGGVRVGDQPGRRPRSRAADKYD